MILFLEESYLGLRFSKIFLADLKKSLGLVENDFAYFIFQIFCRFWSIFRIFAAFDCLSCPGVPSLVNF